MTSELSRRLEIPVKGYIMIIAHSQSVGNCSINLISDVKRTLQNPIEAFSVPAADFNFVSTANAGNLDKKITKIFGIH